MDDTGPIDLLRSDPDAVADSLYYGEYTPDRLAEALVNALRRIAALEREMKEIRNEAPNREEKP